MWTVRSKLKVVEIEIVELFSNLTKNDAMHFHDYLWSCLDEGRHYQLINFKQVKEIDNVAINALADFSNKELYIAIFNVNPDILQKIKISGKFDHIRVFNEKDQDKVISLIEDDISTKMIFQQKRQVKQVL